MIRRPVPGELAALAPHLASLPLLQRYGNTADRLAASMEVALARGDDFLIAEMDGVPAGLAWFYVSGTFRTGGYLRLIAIRAGAERKGLGAALLTAVEEAVAVHSRSLFVLTSDWNSDARRFYARSGYQELGSIPTFVLADTDEIILYKKL